MNIYLDVVQLIIMTIGAFAAIYFSGYFFKKKGTIEKLIFWMYMLSLEQLICEYINYFSCKDNQIKPICIGTWIAFSTTMLQSLGFLASLQFLTYFILQTQSKEFLEEISRSYHQLLAFSFLLPVAINTLNFIELDTYYNIFLPPTTRFQVIVLFTSLFFILLIISIFTLLSIKQLKCSQDFSIRFKENYNRALKIKLKLIWFNYVPFMILLICAQFLESLNIAYFIWLGIINTQVLQNSYLFGYDPFIQKIQLSKISKMKGIQASDIEESDSDIRSQTNTNTNTYTETNLTFQNLRQSNTPSKIAEISASRNSTNIKSDSQKPKLVGSEKQKVTTVEMKKKAASQVNGQVG